MYAATSVWIKSLIYKINNLKNNIRKMGFQEWYNSPAGKRVVGVAYSAGAAIVIVGALFKIMHWPGAGIMLTAGMCTEAVLFLIGVCDKPHKEYHWELVWPELGDEAEGEAHGAAAKTEALEVPEVNVKNLLQEKVQSLSANIEKLNSTAAGLANLNEAANVSSAYISNVNAASQAAGAFAKSQANLTSSSDALVSSYKDIESSISSASAGSKNFASSMDGINKNISTIVSAFDAQAKSAQDQNNAMQTLAASIKKIEASLNSSAAGVDAYKAEVDKLAGQMKTLNQVYGNMLNAMTIRG